MESKHYLQGLTDKARQCMASTVATLTSSKALVMLIKRYIVENDEEKKKSILSEIQARETGMAPAKTKKIL